MRERNICLNTQQIYRDGKKIVSKYVGKDEIEEVREQVDKRRHIEAMVKSLMEEQQLATKILEGSL